MQIRVVWRVYLFVNVQHSSNAGVSKGIDQRRICLQCHSTIQPIEIQSRDHWRLIEHGRFRLHDGCQYSDFKWRKTEIKAALETILIPPFVMLLKQTIHQSLFVTFPPTLIGVWNDAPQGQSLQPIDRTN